MNTPWMLITGCSILGFHLPEILAAWMKKPVPLAMNFMSAIACGRSRLSAGLCLAGEPK